jgi:lipopolysaccharide export system ATP-binding protein
MASIISTDDVTKTYGNRTVVNHVSIHVEKGTVVGLLGPNGAGKTTTFYMVVGLVRPDTGRVIMDGMDITRMPIHKRARHGIGYLAQEASIFRRMTVEENLIAILEFLEPDRKKRKQRAHELMEEFHVTHVAKSPGYALSGGERRRVEIARALCNSPDFLLLDEPFAGVDPIAVQEIQRIIAYLKRRGLGILITDHNVRETLKITERAYVIHQGKILVEGGINEITRNEEAKRIYLGDTFEDGGGLGGAPIVAPGSLAPEPPPEPAPRPVVGGAASAARADAAARAAAEGRKR